MVRSLPLELVSSVAARPSGPAPAPSDRRTSSFDSILRRERTARPEARRSPRAKPDEPAADDDRKPAKLTTPEEASAAAAAAGTADPKAATPQASEPDVDAAPEQAPSGTAENAAAPQPQAAGALIRNASIQVTPQAPAQTFVLPLPAHALKTQAPQDARVESAVTPLRPLVPHVGEQTPVSHEASPPDASNIQPADATVQATAPETAVATQVPTRSQAPTTDETEHIAEATTAADHTNRGRARESHAPPEPRDDARPANKPVEGIERRDGSARPGQDHSKQDRLPDGQVRSPHDSEDLQRRTPAAPGGVNRNDGSRSLAPSVAPFVVRGQRQSVVDPDAAERGLQIAPGNASEAALPPHSPPAAGAGRTTTAGPAHSQNVAEQFTVPTATPIDRLSEALSTRISDGQWHVRLQLDPPELGQVRLDVTMHHETLHMRIMVENENVRQLVESRMVELHDALTKQDMPVARSEVVVRPSHDPSAGDWQQRREDASSQWNTGQNAFRDGSGSGWKGQEPSTGPHWFEAAGAIDDASSNVKWSPAAGAIGNRMLDLVA